MRAAQAPHKGFPRTSNAASTAASIESNPISTSLSSARATREATRGGVPPIDSDYEVRSLFPHPTKWSLTMLEGRNAIARIGLAWMRMS